MPEIALNRPDMAENRLKMAQIGQNCSKCVLIMTLLCSLLNSAKPNPIPKIKVVGQTVKL